MNSSDKKNKRRQYTTTKASVIQEEYEGSEGTESIIPRRYNYPYKLRGPQSIKSGSRRNANEDLSDSSGGEVYVIKDDDTASNFTETSIKKMSNDGTSSQGSGFSYLRHKPKSVSSGIKSARS